MTMSKIAKAVERAKKSRQAHARDIERIRIRGQAPVEPPGPAAQPPAAYTQTRVVSLDSGRLEKNRLFTLLDDPAVIDTYNVLCTQILERSRADGRNAIMVTSCIDGEGKTITAINLAVSIARRQQHSVLLVDADLRKPMIQRYMGLDTRKGLSDHLKKDEPISTLLVNPGLPKMVVLPAGRPIPGTTEILSSPRMEKLVQEMKTRYPERYVVFDCPPLLTVPDSSIFTSYVDGIVLVVEAGRTPTEQIQEAIKSLNGKPLLGLVMNKYKSPRKGYYYYYGR